MYRKHLAQQKFFVYTHTFEWQILYDFKHATKDNQNIVKLS